MFTYLYLLFYLWYLSNVGRNKVGTQVKLAGIRSRVTTDTTHWSLVRWRRAAQRSLRPEGTSLIDRSLASAATSGTSG